MKAILTRLLLIFSVISLVFSGFYGISAAVINPMDVARSVKSFYFKDNCDFTLGFKVNSKMRDIAFDGNFMFRPPMSFAVNAASQALQVRIIFREGDGFIYIPTANIITNLDKMTQLKTKSIQMPKNVQQLDSKLDQLTSDFDLTASEEPGDIIKIAGKSKKAKGSFNAMIDKKSYELKSIVTFTSKGNEEMSIEFKNYKKESVPEKTFEKPKNAIETNLPVPIF